MIAFQTKWYFKKRYDLISATRYKFNNATNKPTGGSAYQNIRTMNTHNKVSAVGKERCKTPIEVTRILALVFPASPSIKKNRKSKQTENVLSKRKATGI